MTTIAEPLSAILASAWAVRTGQRAGRLTGVVPAMQARDGSEAKEMARAGHDPAKRIAEVQQKLKQLLLRAQRAALMGDKRTAGALAKEASGLARELAEAVHEARVQGQQVAAGPSDIIPPTVVSDPEISPSKSLTVVPEIPSPPIDPGLLKEVEKAMTLLRGALALAKATIRRKERLPRTGNETAETARARKELEAAEQEMQKAAESIQADISLPTSGIGTRAGFSALA
jgi:hypothetical protein